MNGAVSTASSISDASTGAVLSINSNGVMTSQNSTNSCVLNGSVSTNEVIMAVTGAFSTNKYSIVSTLNGS